MNDVLDEDFIRDQIEKKIHEAHAEILERHNIKSGDVTPSEKIEIDDAVDEVVKATENWVQSSARKLVYAQGGLEVYKNPYGEFEISNVDTGNTVILAEEELNKIKSVETRSYAQRFAEEVDGDEGEYTMELKNLAKELSKTIDTETPESLLKTALKHERGES